MPRPASLFALLLILFPFTAAHAQSPLSPAQRQHEAAILESALRNLHPGLYRYNSPERIDSLFAALRADLEGAESTGDYFIQLAQLTTELRCGHTFPNPYNQPAAVQEVCFSTGRLPLLWKVVDGEFIVTHLLADGLPLAPGDELHAINGTPAAAIRDSLLTVSRTDGTRGQARQLNNLSLYSADADSSNYALFDVYFPLFFPVAFAADSFLLSYLPYGAAEVRSVRVTALTPGQRHRAYARRYGPVPTGEAGWQFRYPEPERAYLKLSDFFVWTWQRDYRVFLDSVFAVLAERQTATLVVDIRGNEGGSGGARDDVLRYLIDRPVGCANPRRDLFRSLAIPDSLLPYLETYQPGLLQPRDPARYPRTAEGLYRANGDGPCEPLQPREDRYRGEIFLLTDARNASASFVLADRLRESGNATLVGEPTGGNRQGLNAGLHVFLRLPHSGMEIDVPLLWQATTDPRPEGGVVPDIVVQETAGDIAAGRDAALADQ